MQAWGPMAGKRVIPGAQGGLGIGPSAPAPGAPVSRQPQPWVLALAATSLPSHPFQGRGWGWRDSPAW